MQKIVAALFALLLALPAAADELAVSLPGHDDFVLSLPDDWRAKIDRPGAELPPTIIVTSPGPTAFQVLVTPIWPMRPGMSPTLEGIRRLVEEAATEASSRAVERNLPLKDFEGPGKSGYYFFATDREPEPDGYKYLTQGAFRFGELRVTFTILVNGEPGKATDKALEMLRNSRRSPARRSA